MKRYPGFVFVMLSFASYAWGDEGMWTFHDFPTDLVQRKYGIEITPPWLERVRNATVRLSGCTASFVSPHGLILTNHHCVARCLADNSNSQEDRLAGGFLARERAREVRCATQHADVLAEVEDITARVGATTLGLDAQAANEARKRELTKLEQSCEIARQGGEGRARKCQAVTLYGGAQFFLYKYRRYEDVRLVFAPEHDIAAFGGDPDNFQFPRWSLDMALLRVYEANGSPGSPPGHLSIDFDGPRGGEPLFVSGHPGSTDRQLTVSQLETLRDVTLPRLLLWNSELRGRYIQFAKTSGEAARIVQVPLSGLENGLKVRRKLLDALNDERFLKQVTHAEEELQAKVRANPQLTATIGTPWKLIEQAQETVRAIGLPHTFIERGGGFNSQLFDHARHLVRAAAERERPNIERLREYTETALPRLRQRLAAETPIHAELEKLTLSFSLERMREWLGPDHPLVRELLAKTTPDGLAARLVEGTKLASAEGRLELWEGGARVIESSDDPMIELARRVDPRARALRRRYEDEVAASVRSASEQIARARFAIYGTDAYPDATFTLRLNFGSVQGWIESGERIEPYTNLRRLFERATGNEPFRIPRSWLAAKDRLQMDTRFNLTTNNDIVGGNSGSPLIDGQGRIVGLMFDGNIHSISGTYWFDADQNRAVAVHPAVMREALSKVYRADALLAELTADSRRGN